MGIADNQEQKDRNSDLTPSSHSNKHLLVIDDQETVCEAVIDILDLENIPVITALSGQAGLDVYREHQAEIGLVLLDLSMPDMNGYETYQALRQVNPQVRVVLSSGYDEKAVLHQFDKEGLVGFLKKPYNLRALIKTVKQHMDS